METAVPTSADTSERRLTVLRARREWSVAEKRSIVAETRIPGANVSAISRKRGAAQSLIYQWRKLYGPTDVTPTGSAPAFLPVAIAASVPNVQAAAEPANSGMIEIILSNGRRVRADANAEPAKLARLVAALDGDA
jgi:transposase